MHPAGKPVAVLVCWPFESHSVQLPYVNDVHATGDDVHACVSTGAAVGVPVHPDGVLPVTVLVCWPFEPQADQAEYVYPVHAAGGAPPGHPKVAIAPLGFDA